MTENNEEYKKRIRGMVKRAGYIVGPRYSVRLLDERMKDWTIKRKVELREVDTQRGLVEPDLEFWIYTQSDDSKWVLTWKLPPEVFLSKYEKIA